MATTDEYLYFKNREPSEDDELLMSATDDSRIMFGPTSGLGGGVQMPEGMNEAQQMNYLREILRGEWNQRELSESSGLGGEFTMPEDMTLEQQVWWLRSVNNQENLENYLRGDLIPPEQMSGAQMAAETAAGFSPLGPVIDAVDLYRAYGEGDAVSGTMAAAGLIFPAFLGFDNAARKTWRRMQAGDFSDEVLQAAKGDSMRKAVEKLGIAKKQDLQHGGLKQEVYDMAGEDPDSTMGFLVKAERAEIMREGMRDDPLKVLGKVKEIDQNKIKIGQLTSAITHAMGTGEKQLVMGRATFGSRAYDDAVAQAGPEGALAVLAKQKEALLRTNESLMERVQKDLTSDPFFKQVIQPSPQAKASSKPSYKFVDTSKAETQMIPSQSARQAGTGGTEAFTQPERLHYSQAGARTATEIMPGLQDVQHGLSETRGMSASELEPLMSTQEIPISHLGKVPSGPSMGTLVQKDPEARLLVDAMRQEGAATQQIPLSDLRKVGELMEQGYSREGAERAISAQNTILDPFKGSETRLTWHGGQ